MNTGHFMIKCLAGNSVCLTINTVDPGGKFRFFVGDSLSKPRLGPIVGFCLRSSRNIALVKRSTMSRLF